MNNIVCLNCREPWDLDEVYSGNWSDEEREEFPRRCPCCPRESSPLAERIVGRAHRSRRCQVTEATTKVILAMQHTLQQNLESRRMNRDSLTDLHVSLLNHIRAHGLDWSKVCEGRHTSQAAHEAECLILEAEQALGLLLRGRRLDRHRVSKTAGRIYRFCRLNNLSH